MYSLLLAMKNLLTKKIRMGLVGMLFLLPQLTLAQFDPSGGELGLLLQNIMIFANDVLIPFIISIGFLFFVWGMFRYFIAGGADEESREKGRSLMIHATLGFVIIIIFFGVVNMITSSLGLEGQTIDNVPGVFGVSP